MGAITTAILATAAVASAGATVMQGRAANEAARVQARNTEAEQQNRQLEFVQQMAREREKSRRAMSTIRARMAQTGLSSTQGTTLEILGESAGNIELSFQDAARRQFIQDQSLTAQAGMLRFQGRQAQTSAYISAGGQLLQAAGDMGSDYAKAVADGGLKDRFGIYHPKPNVS